MRDLLATVEFNLARYRLNLPEITGQSLHMACHGPGSLGGPVHLGKKPSKFASLFVGGSLQY